MAIISCIAASASTLSPSPLLLAVFDTEALPPPAAAVDESPAASPLAPDFFAKLARWSSQFSYEGVDLLIDEVRKTNALEESPVEFQLLNLDGSRAA